MEFFDCCINYGPNTMSREFPGCPDIGTLRGDLKRAGIAGGLAAYAVAEPILANWTVARDLAGLGKNGADGPEADGPEADGPEADGPEADGLEPELYGVWELLPSVTGELPPPGELPSEMRKNRIAALTLNPRDNRFLPRASAIGDYLEMASARAIPVLLNTGRGLALEQMDDIMRDFKGLTAILTFENCWPSDRLIRPFLESYPNLYLDMAFIQTAAGLPDIVAKHSARRVLFGSGYPECYPGAHIPVILHADIGEGDKHLIAGGNLRRILEGACYE